MRLVAVLAAFGQLLVAGAAWLDAADAARGDARPHVEEGGVSSHNAHVESSCVLCAVLHVGGTAVAAPRANWRSAPEPTLPAAAVNALPHSAASVAHLSRAPPNAR